MSTEVQYGPIKLSYVRTQTLDCVPAMDPSGTDQELNKFTYQCAAIFTKELDPAVGLETPAQTYQRVREALTKPRQALKITSFGHTLLESPALDSANGPKPLPGVSITRITDECFAVVWGVEVYKHPCENGGQKIPVLSLRWVQTHEVDERNYSTFTTTGRLSAATDLLRGLPIDCLRPLCIPHQPVNCTRRSRYTVQADGRAIDFTFTDQEQYLVPEKEMAKAGVVKVGGTYERIVLGGVCRVVRLSLRMEARKTTPKRKLMAMCAGQALARIRAGRPAGGKVFIKEGCFREHLGDNVVEIYLTALAQDLAATAAVGIAYALGQGPFAGGFAIGAAIGAALSPADQNAQGRQPPGQGPVIPTVGLGLDAFGIRLQGMGDPVDEVPGIAPDLRGQYDRLLMIAAALRDPCLAAWPFPVDQIENEAHLKSFQKLPEEHKLRTPFDSRLKTPALLSESTTNTLGPIVTQVSALPPAFSINLQGYTDPYVGVYTEYETTLAYVNERGGRDVLPATKAGYPAAKVQVSNDLVRLQASWTATKVGGTPTVPSWKEPLEPSNSPGLPLDSNAVCVNVAIQPEMVEVAADGVSLVHKITGVYEYGFKDASKVKMHSPLPPWTTLTTDKLPGYPTDDSIVFGDPQTSRLVSR